MKKCGHSSVILKKSHGSKSLHLIYLGQEVYSPRLIVKPMSSVAHGLPRQITVKKRGHQQIQCFNDSK